MSDLRDLIARVEAGEGADRGLDAKRFRASLIAIMPGYDWTVHRAVKGSASLRATGITSSGFNRLSTLEVTWEARNGIDWYTARSSGFGKRAPWLHTNGDVTLARALRGLQDYYRRQSAVYAGHEAALAGARKPNPDAAILRAKAGV